MELSIHRRDTMKVVKKRVDTLLPAVYNPRKDLTPDDREYQKIKKSIEEFGYVEPIIYNVATNTIVGGHQRLKVLKELGYTEIDVVEIEETEEREKALNIALNKIEGEWDMALLKDLLQELDTGEIDMDLTGFEDWEMEQLMTQFHVEDESFEEDDEEDIEAMDKADVMVVIGEYRIKVDRAVYDDWLNKLRMDVGFDKESIEKEIMERLQL